MFFKRKPKEGAEELAATKKKKRFALNAVCFILALKVAVFMALPFLYMVLMSLLPESSVCIPYQ